MWDKDRCPFPAKETVPEDIQPILVVKAIKWDSEKDYRDVALQKIVNEMKPRTEDRPTKEVAQEFTDKLIIPGKMCFLF